ncbi:hypothetical protein [Hespellia stercorisuis]|uniref:DUF4064 domain-containing protein n=1 Tax=Hespellia stercorisuis DSM 15480 TaxID=1121950 RepID=A0A1M6Q2A2_9FIRM|nr:hypothetical protein [Hespellia stercorisuis]SHK14349.1 hypothetical protein SAMN02745243_02302 [Hespellia stercorisuis DSM 15480]
MLQQTKFLKVMSIIVLVFSAFSAIGVVILIAANQMIQPVMEKAGVDNWQVSVALSIVSVIAAIVGAVTGLIRKYAKVTMICAGIYVAICVISLIMLAVAGTFTPVSLIDLVVPLLFAWSVYQAM